MSLLVPILAAVLLLLAVGATIGTLGYRRARPRRSLRGRQDLLALDASPELQLRAFVAETRALRHLLEELATAGRTLLGLDELVDVGARRPLWRRLSDAGYVHNAGALRQPVESWLLTEERVRGDLQGLTSPARAQLVEISERLSRSLEDTRRLTALHGSIIAAAEALEQLARELASHNPRAYR